MNTILQEFPRREGFFDQMEFCMFFFQNLIIPGYVEGLDHDSHISSHPHIHPLGFSQLMTKINSNIYSIIFQNLFDTA